ncbi:ubiquitin carboxyl-terminal hydrolase 11 [Anaeramoeba flamelloides]|uniref:ubiquitinyl hydrolase 1 n=1 Tax=Anaeramoeba flamelloides TaxID=1746091 RepID=A0ABQ8XUT5_9EUKA|nr:ubiquitin carboxyl-terminal hydrolase 11 [Anaeramoeba flamelloides]
MTKNKNKSESKTEQKDPKNETKSQDSNDKKTKVDFKNLSISEEFALIEESKKKHEELIENESWCLINFSWYKQWVEYIEQKDQEDVENLKYPKPGKIDNSPLFENNQLKRDLKENEDYTLVHKETSKLFQEIYGGMEKISKKVIKIGKKKHQKIVEIYNLTFYIHCLEDGNLKKKATVHLSRSLKHLDLFDLIANTWKVPIKKVRIYILNQGKIGKEIKNKKKFLYSSRLEDFEKVFFEIKGYKEPPRVSKKKKKNKSSSSDNDHDHDHDPDSDPQQTKFSVLKVWKKKSQQKNQLNKYSGLVGLNNLGNTCFMNSSLQCLLNTIVIRDYFLTNKYSKEINKKNKIGMGGKLAKAFAELEQNYWTTRSSSISPRNLKFVIGRFASQFMGFSQQDSHELLSFLLDGLHEDLNRIKKKPYIQDIDGKNCKDLPKLARDSWKNYKKRNDSFIVDHFQGLLRNRLECPKCKTVSYKFDPCRYLSVPLPSSLEFSLAVTLIPVNKQKKMLKYYITIQKTLGLDGVLTELSTLTGIETNRLCLAEIYNNNIYKIFTSNNAFFKISKKDIIVAFEFPETPKDKKDSKDIKDTKDSKDTKNTKNKKDTKNTKNKEDDEDKEDKEDKEELYYVPMNYQIMKFNKFRCAGIPELFRFPLKSKMNYESFYSLCTERLFNCIPELLEKTEKLEKELSKKSNQSDKSDLNSESSKNGKEKTEEDTGEGSESGKGEGSESGMEKGNKKKKEKKADKEKKNNKKLSKEEKAIIKQGFQLNELYPLFRIVTIHKRKRKAQTITLLDENSEISIKDNIRIYLRFNPYLLQKFPKILDPLSEIEPHSSLKKYQKSLKKGKFSSQTSLSKCIDCFLTTEKLSKENTWYCSDCKEHVQAWKKFDIWELPNVLIIQLKRFTQSRYSRRKIDKYVEFPEILDMCDYLIGPNKNSKKYKYKLYAVSNHYGGVGGGHYTAFGKSHSTQKWYSYNDSRCSRVNGSDAVKTSAAYVLFYQKINPQENNNEKDEESKKNENGNGNGKGKGVEKDKDKKTEKKNQKNDKDKKKEKKKKDKKKEKDNQEKENKNKKDEGSNNKKKKKDEKGNEKSEKDKDKKTEKNDQKNDKEKKKEKKKKDKTKEKDNQDEENKNKKDEGSNNEKDEESKKDEKENEKSEKDKDKKTEKNDQKDDKEKKKEKKKKDKKKEKDNQEEETKSKKDDKKMKEENEKKGKEQEKDDDKDNNSDEEENEANK